jgi:hypothetical protein
MNFKIIVNLNFGVNTKGTDILWHVAGNIFFVLKQRQKNLLQMEGFC